jgi:hypothetical protein
VGLFPAPVRDAQIAMTGRVDRSMVWRGLSSLNSAPAAFARLARCITASCETSEYDITHTSTPSSSTSASSRSSSWIGMPRG